MSQHSSPTLPTRGRRQVGAGIFFVALSSSALLLAGCSSGEPAAAGTASHTTSASTTKKALPQGVYRFGKVATLEDGSKVVVSKPVLFTPTKFAKTDKKKHVKVLITFTNNSAKTFDPFYTTGKASSGETEAPPVRQAELRPPKNNVLPGKKVKWLMGFGVDDPKKLTVTVSMGTDLDDAIFTNEL